MTGDRQERTPITFPRAQGSFGLPQAKSCAGLQTALVAARTAVPATRTGELKTIEAFRSNPLYAGDGNRIDLAYAVYALAHGVDTASVSTAIRTRDLSKKGNEKRQNDYVNRTIEKALTTIERGRSMSR